MTRSNMSRDRRIITVLAGLLVALCANLRSISRALHIPEALLLAAVSVGEALLAVRYLRVRRRECSPR